MNMKNTRSMRIVTIILIFITTVYAQDHKRLTLTLGESVKLGLENSTSLHSSLMKVQSANAKSSEATASRLPKLSFGGTFTRLSEVPPYVVEIPFLPAPYNEFELSPAIYNNYMTKVSLQQPLFTGFKVESGANMAELNSNATEQDYRNDKTDLIFDIKNAYWNLFKTQQVKSVLDENISQMQAHLKDVQNMLSQGLATNNDVLKVEVQLSNVELSQLDMANNIQLAMLNLNFLINQPLDTEIELSSSPSDSESAVIESLDQLVSNALAQRSDVKGMEYRVKASEAGVSFAQSGWYPQLYLVGNYYYSRPNQRILPTQDRFDDTWDASLSISFDIWNWGQTHAQVQQAEAQLEQANDGLIQIRKGIAMEVTSSYLSLKKSRESIALAGQGVKQAEENYRITNEKFKAGLASNSDVLDAEVAMLQAKTNYTNSLVDFELAQAHLQKSLGELE